MRLPFCPLIPIGIALAFSLVAAASARAQLTEPSSERPRDAEYRDLAEEASRLEREGNLLKKAVRLVTPTVVHIEAAKGASEEERLARQPVEEAGSGVIISRDDSFYVLTNRHVIRDSALPQIKIKLADGRVLNPSRVWADQGTDVAIMQVRGEGLTPARLGDSDALEIGDFVIAVGSPFGLNHSVTFGIISAKGRRDLKLGDGTVKFQNFLQTDAAINPGNSGGPLLNLRGEVIGINTAIASSSGGSEGIGFAIPIKMVMNVANQLVDRGSVTRAYLGVRLDTRFDSRQALQMGLTTPVGALVSGVTPRSPAALVDIRAGDLILAVNGTRVEDDAHLVTLMGETPVGEPVALTLLRNGSPVQLSVRAGEREKFEAE